MFESWKLRKLQRECRKKQKEKNREKVIHLKHGQRCLDVECFVKDQREILRNRIGDNMFKNFMKEVGCDGKDMPRSDTDKRDGEEDTGGEGFSATVPFTSGLDLPALRGWVEEDTEERPEEDAD